MWRGVKSGLAITGGRAAPLLSHRAASVQWLGEVKAPDNISIVAPGALLGCRCFSSSIFVDDKQNRF
ncbi:50S ribosomal protein L12-1 chloroplastic [Dissostichus eleginoides]|uniref:50S ribosomal protein L12-1 chloroplastic n=1 Tax=Dissostichus eleginoides TaxID=100907 RepID=A0AAD9B9M9_DISEL|nr:50S ribosomal protein L12-1 chloroplastic [Dissostichus eleginoides]